MGHISYYYNQRSNLIAKWNKPTNPSGQQFNTQLISQILAPGS